MNIAYFEYQELEPYYNQYLSIINDVYQNNIGVYNNMFNDELFGYRKGKLELMIDILYFNDYLYSIIQQIKELEQDTIENRIALLNINNWECVVKTLLCKGIRIGKYYNQILEL